MLRAVIVGGGIAGLSTAVALRRAGHVVAVYERTQLDNEVGAAINVPPNASRFLVGSWGLDPARSRFVRATGLTWHDPFADAAAVAPGGGTCMSHARNVERFGADLWLAHREDLHAALRRLATDPGAGPGVPVQIYPGSRVLRYDPNAPSITLASGEVIEADLVVGADGVHSVASVHVLVGSKPHVAPAHYNYCYRFLIPRSVLEKDPETRYWNVGAEGNTRIFADNERKRRLVAYPCRDNTVHNFVFLYHDDSPTPVYKENYLATQDHLEFMQRFSGFHPSILSVVEFVLPPFYLVLCYGDIFLRLTSIVARRSMSGDGDYSTVLPFPRGGRADQAQGGAQGMEDAAALGIVLQGVSSPAEIERRLELYQNIRRNRASAIQILSNVGSDQCHLVYEDLKQFLAEPDIPTNPAEILEFNFGYDVVKESSEAVKKLTGSYPLSSSNRGTNMEAVGNVRGRASNASRLSAAVH